MHAVRAHARCKLVNQTLDSNSCFSLQLCVYTSIYIYTYIHFIHFFRFPYFTSCVLSQIQLCLYSLHRMVISNRIIDSFKQFSKTFLHSGFFYEIATKITTRTKNIFSKNKVHYF